MWIDVIALLLAAAGVATIAIVSVRKLPAVANIDVTHRREEHHARVKTDLIAHRLQRKLTTGLQWLLHTSKPVRARVVEGFRALVVRIEKLERDYRHKARHLQVTTDTDTAKRVTELLDEATELQKEGEYEHAEQHYIEAISLAPTTLRAFQGLGELYLTQKEYTQAAETLLHALKLAPENDSILLDLAEVHQAQGNVAAALKRCQQAVALRPNDPKNLNALLEASITIGERELAERTLEQLEFANPENQKLAALREQVQAIPPDPNPPVRKSST